MAFGTFHIPCPSDMRSEIGLPIGRNMPVKRFLALIIVLLLLSGTFAGVYSASVLDTADKVEFEERIVYGDPSAADGLHIRFFNEYLALGS